MRDRGETVEAAVMKSDPVAMGSEPGAGGIKRHLILVEPDQGETIVGRQKSTGVAGTAKGGVDDITVGDIGEHVNDLGQHHRIVYE